MSHAAPRSVVQTVYRQEADPVEVQPVACGCHMTCCPVRGVRRWRTVQPTVTVQPTWRVIEKQVVPPAPTYKTTPTPIEVIEATLTEFQLTARDVICDPGCGADARVLISASARYGCRGLGIEIDRERAAAARKAVQDAGLSHLIDVRHGNAALVDPSFYRSVTAAYFFLEPKTIAAIIPKLPTGCRVASFSHLPTTREVNHQISVGGQPVFFHLPGANQ